MTGLLVLTAVCEGLGLGLVGAVAFRMLRPNSPVMSAMDGRAWTAGSVAMTTVAVVLLVNAPGTVIELILVCLITLVYLAFGLLVGSSVLAPGYHVDPGERPIVESVELVDLGRQLADASGQVAQLSRELATTSTALAESRQREQIADAARRRLVGWFSQVLEAPVTRMVNTIESEMDDVDSDRAPVLVRLRTDAHRLADTVGDLIHLARIHDVSSGAHSASVSLDDLVSDVVAELDEVAAEHGVCLRPGRIESVVASVEHREIAGAVRELLTNAIRCGAVGSTVSIDTWPTASDAVVSITDECGGIPEPDLGAVFDVGWRGADTGERGGLGLTIVREIVRAHRGHVLVRNVPGGCCFEIRLPLTGGG